MAEWDHATDLDARPGCEGKSGIFIDYDSPFGDHSEAKAVCDTCPLFNLCEQYAREVKPAWGVWAKRVWVHGRTRGIKSIYEEDHHDGTESGGAEVIELDPDADLELVG